MLYLGAKVNETRFLTPRPGLTVLTFTLLFYDADDVDDEGDDDAGTAIQNIAASAFVLPSVHPSTQTS